MTEDVKSVWMKNQEWRRTKSISSKYYLSHRKQHTNYTLPWETVCFM